MFRRAVSLLVLIAFISLLLYSCSGDGSVEPGTCSDDTDRDLEKALNADADVHELMDLRMQLTERALYGNVTSSQLRCALETGDAEYIGALFGYSGAELEGINERMLRSCEAISGKYPEIRQRVEEISASSSQPCDIEAFLEHWDTVLEAHNADISESSCIEPAICEIVPLTVGLVVCAITSGGNVGYYLACGYVVICASCEGGWADLICW